MAGLVEPLIGAMFWTLFYLSGLPWARKTAGGGGEGEPRAGEVVGCRRAPFLRQCRIIRHFRCLPPHAGGFCLGQPCCPNFPLVISIRERVVSRLQDGAPSLAHRTRYAYAHPIRRRRRHSRLARPPRLPHHVSRSCGSCSLLPLPFLLKFVAAASWLAWDVLRGHYGTTGRCHCANRHSRPGGPNTATCGHGSWCRAIARRAAGAGWAGMGCLRAAGCGARGAGAMARAITRPASCQQEQKADRPQHRENDRAGDIRRVPSPMPAIA